MPVELLTGLGQKIDRITSYLIGNHRITLSMEQDFAVLSNGIQLWIGVLLDHNLLLGLNAQETLANRGRILSLLPWLGSPECDLTPLLTLLDDFDRCLLDDMSQPRPFKGAAIRKMVKACCYHSSLVSLVALTLREFDRGNLDDITLIRLLHQTFSFLKKVEVDRPDLRRAAIAEFRSFEEGLRCRDVALNLQDQPPVSFQDKRGSDEVVVPRSQRDILIEDMNTLLRAHVTHFSTEDFVPKHGPGVVAQTGISSWYDKNISACVAPTVRLLLAVNGLGTYEEYVPFGSSNITTRTSRFISVPKTWKKLRGISAEPVELQFFQQAVLRMLDNMFMNDPWWAERVNLHSQEKSRYLAIIGSITDGLATIDLSNASDSVTLELVKQVFKGTPILPWLLGTRSTHTTCGDAEPLKIRKFAPMGSACCFPVECIIFTLAAQVACDRERLPCDPRPRVRVFGDDIVVNDYASDTCVSILELLGFSVNKEKSYTKGPFREACGVEAYHGSEVQPIRYKAVRSSFKNHRFTPEDLDTLRSYANSCYDRGYLTTRRLIFTQLLASSVVVGRKAYLVRQFLFTTFLGQNGTFCSPMPTNFNCKVKYSTGLQCKVVWRLSSRLRLCKNQRSSANTELYSMMLYHQWLLRHQPGSPFEDLQDRELDGTGVFGRLDPRIPLGFRTIPRLTWVPWTFSDSLL